MARVARVSYPGAIYHVTVRRGGEIGKAYLFRDDLDRERWVERLAERVEQFEVRLYAYVLMRTHLHMVLETPRGNVSAFVQSLNTAYAVYYNLRHQRRGHVTQGRFTAKLVEGDAYLLSLSRYVHLNPVHTEAMRRKDLEERLAFLRSYPWSSYRSYAGRSRRLPFLDYGPVLGACGSRGREQERAYRDYVEGSLGEEDGELLDAMKASALCIGSEDFRDWIKDRYLDAVGRRNPVEDVSLRRVLKPIPSETILRTAAGVMGVEESALRERRRDSHLRAVASWLLCRHGGLTQRQAASVLGMSSGEAVGAQIRKVKALRQTDRRVRRQLAEADRRLAGASRRE